jgi:hypothetical protein
MTSTNMVVEPVQEEFGSKLEYHEALKRVSQLPKGFRVGTTRFSFLNEQVNAYYNMSLTLIGTYSEVIANSTTSDSSGA